MSGFVYSEKPIEIVGGDGVHLTGADGTEYLDFGASYACAPVGHCHPDVVEATVEQARELLYVQGSYPVAAREAVHERLAALAPGDVDNVWLANSGAEAVEAALKFARSATTGTKFVAAQRGFHGRTMGALSVTWKPKYREPFEPLPEAEFVPYGDADALADAVDDDVAAVVLEPVQGEGGANVPPDGYLEAARDAADAADAALVLDEIQTGLGRTGTVWACERAGVVPDVLTTAKGLASGFPMSAALCADWIADAAGPHGSTFSGTPVVAAAADATLQTLIDEALPQNAAEMGASLQSKLAAAGFSVRGEGLLVGVEVENAMGTLKRLAVEHQVLALPAGRRVVRLLPPLTVDEQHVDEVVAALAAVEDQEVLA